VSRSLRGFAVSAGAFVALLGVGAAFAFGVASPFWLDLVFWVVFWAALAQAWNIVGGYVGQLSLGHTAFFGIGAYTSTLADLHWDLTPWLGSLLGAALAAAVGLVVAVVCLRLRGPFFALATLALAELLLITAIQWRDLTEGAEGLTLPFSPGLGNLMFETKTGFCLYALGLFALVSAVAIAIEHTRIGLLLHAIRNDEDGARSVGVRVLRWKVAAAAVSAGLTALCGTLYAQYLQVIEPSTVFNWEISVQLALLAIIGGRGTWTGAIVGSLFLTPLAIGLRAWLGSSHAGLHLVVYGPVLILSVLFIPEGIMPWVATRWHTARARRQAVTGAHA